MKKIVLGSLMACTALAANAQKYLGVATSNYSGISGMYLNPANIADNRERLVIDFLNINTGIDNSLGKINTIGNVYTFIKDDNANVNDVFSFSNKEKFSLHAPYAEVRGPGVMVSINHRHSFAVTTRLRGTNQFNNFDQTLYRTILDTSYASQGNVALTAQNFNWTAHVWMEAALSYGAIVLEKGRHEVKVGATVRYLGGLGYLGLKGNNLDVGYVKGQDSFYANNTDLSYASNILTAEGALSITNSNFFKKFFGKSQGNGIGADLGVVYDYMGDDNTERYDMDGKTGLSNQEVNRYKVRVSASVTDIGHITYDQKNNYGLSISGDGYLTSRGLSGNVKNFDDFRNYAKSQGFRADTGRITSKVYMPTTMILSADYHASRNIYVNAMYIGNLANRQNYGNSYYNQFTLTPRYDTRNYSIGVPITYSTLTTAMKLGVGIRAKGFFIGSDDMLVFFTNRQYGLNVYGGAYLVLHKRRPADRDRDHVSDSKDRCPDDFGSWRYKGCPDKDENNSADSADNCPEATGLPVRHENRTGRRNEADNTQHEEGRAPNTEDKAGTGNKFFSRAQIG
ncbi:MAG: hypothetical protein H7257_11565 [Taibaiella sp.]|nr:hypothetical protein [Taibaiella sp.]